MSNQPFVEFPGPAQDFIRVTCAPATSYREEPHFRISVREIEGRVRQGPEIPLARVGDLFQAMLELADRCRVENSV